MSEKKNRFKEYIDENINLITVLGIFNGLSIYSSTLKEDSGKYYLGFIFTLISVMVLRELILIASRINDVQISLVAFVVGMSGVWIYLVNTIIKDYTSTAGSLFLILIVGIFFHFMFKIDSLDYIRKFQDKYPKIYFALAATFFISVFLFALITWNYVWGLIQEIFDVLPKKKIIYK